MIVRQFINWVRTAPAGERAEATRALARAWLISDLSDDDRAAAEGALLMLLDDASPLVRQAMAEVFSGAIDAPPSIVAALSVDQPASGLSRRKKRLRFIDAHAIETGSAKGLSVTFNSDSVASDEACRSQVWRYSWARSPRSRKTGDRYTS